MGLDILFCTTIFDTAITGAGRFAQCVAQLPKGDDLRIHVVSEQTEDADTPGGKRFSVSLPVTSRLAWISYAAKSRAYAAKIHQLITLQQIDILFFNDAWLASAWLQSKASIPVLVFVHDDNAIHVRRGVPASWPSLSMRRILERKALNAASGVITNSTYMQSSISAHYDIPIQRIHVLPLAFVDYSSLPFVFQPLKDTEPVRIMYAKHDIVRGGLDLLVDALGAMPWYQFELTIAGCDAGLVSKRYRRTMQTSKHIRWESVGNIPDHDKYLSLLRSHQIFCIPAQREALGVGYMEALASGLRVVYHGTGGIPEKLSLYGYPVGKLTRSALIETLETAIKAPSEHTEARIRAGREWIIREYAIQQMQKQLRDILHAFSTSNPKSLTA